MSTQQTVLSDIADGVMTITLNRPEAANAQNSQMIEDINAAFDSAEADDEVRVVILAAAGKHFSSGHDLKEILRGEEHWAAMRATPEGGRRSTRGWGTPPRGTPRGCDRRRCLRLPRKAR